MQVPIKQATGFEAMLYSALCNQNRIVLIIKIKAPLVFTNEALLSELNAAYLQSSPVFTIYFYNG